MAWGICGGGVWERLQVRLENGLLQLVMDLDSQIKTGGLFCDDGG